MVIWGVTMGLEYLNVIDEVSDDIVERALSIVLNPPIQVINLEGSIARREPFIPSQPNIEYIEVGRLQQIMGPKGLEIFLALDQIISLTPYSTLRSTNPKSLVEVIRYLGGKLHGNLRKIHSLKAVEFRGEDSVKEEILLVLPSKTQVDNVRGKQGLWIWREKTRYGVESPEFEGLVSEILSIGEKLVNLGLKVDVAVDSSTYQFVEDRLYKFNVVTLDMPVDKLKTIYVRDQSVTWLPNPIIGNMALPFRRGEEGVVVEVYHKLGLTPLFRVRWALLDNVLVRAVMEGGNFFVIKGGGGDVVVLSGIGVRGSNWATFKVLGELLPEDVRLVGVPLAGYIRNWELGAVHLDVVFSYLGDLGGVRVALVDPSRLGFYSLLEYDRKTGLFKPVELLKLMKELEVIVDEPPRDGASVITMVNALNLGRGRLVADGFNESVNRYLERSYGVEVVRVDIPHLEAGGGGVRCATRELWRS
jgi:arginine deiminase